MLAALGFAAFNQPPDAKTCLNPAIYVNSDSKSIGLGMVEYVTSSWLVLRKQ